MERGHSPGEVERILMGGGCFFMTKRGTEKERVTAEPPLLDAYNFYAVRLHSHKTMQL